MHITIKIDTEKEGDGATELTARYLGNRIPGCSPGSLITTDPHHRSFTILYDLKPDVNQNYDWIRIK
jgi:hypothetical protein